MQRLKAYLIGSCLVAAPVPASAAFAAHLCATVQVCGVGAKCECAVSARSAGDIYYYWQLDVERAATYTCKLTGFYNGETVMIDKAVLPEGATISCGNSNRFPTTCTIDTTGMSNDKGTVRIKYNKHASDYPDTVTIDCSQVTPVEAVTTL